MYVKNRGLAWATMAVIALLTACGPVKFSSSSNADLDPSGITPTPTPPTGVTPTPTPSGTPTLVDKHHTSRVDSDNYKLDVILVIDDSYSMAAENKKLAERLSGLITKLNNNDSNKTPIDWQMCVTVTRALPINGTMVWGSSIFWQPFPISPYSATPNTSLGMVINRNTTNVAAVIQNTIAFIGSDWADSNDEQGIRAANRHAYAGELSYGGRNGCYRQDSAVTYIIISDEDERSVGGDASQKHYPDELKPLADVNQPQVFVDFFKQIFGADRRFTVNSIIVKPGDSACKTKQDNQGTISHYGFRYAELSALTKGGIGSICDDDYSANMDLFFGKINSSINSVTLECIPYNNAATVTITPVPSNPAIASTVQGNSVVFTSPVPNGSTIDVRYQCLDRLPSSLGKAIVAEQPGFFARIINFFKNLF